MEIEGRLTITLNREGARVTGVAIESSRPLQAARIFEGRTPDEVLRLLPRLYSVCGTAQAAAASRALAGALGVAPAADVTAARLLLVWLETAREHLWRILLDWPEFLEEAPATGPAASLSRLLPEAGRALFGDGDGFALASKTHPDRSALHALVSDLESVAEAAVFGCSPSAWVDEKNPASLEGWMDEGATIAARLLRRVRDRGWADAGGAQVAFLPALQEAALDRRLSADEAEQFIAEPEWMGAVAETTPLARQRNQTLVRALRLQYGNGLLPRLAARLVELATILERLRALLETIESAGDAGAGDRGVEDKGGTGQGAGKGVGLGQVEAARGRLVHRVELDNGLVRCYQILAPTEWNFHPRGVVALGLLRLEARDEAQLQRQAALLINAVDPCVGYELTVTG
ncbi:MAG: nickel-dependent hydrogenase large subunit [Pseudomonadota bacterium]|nr:nickel-dependent hydrogenase large subunit [Pseudomonadota bacterium]